MLATTSRSTFTTRDGSGPATTDIIPSTETKKLIGLRTVTDSEEAMSRVTVSMAAVTGDKTATATNSSQSRTGQMVAPFLVSGAEPEGFSAQAIQT